MLSLKISLVLFALLLIVICVNAVFVTQRIAYFESAIAELPEITDKSCAESAEKLKNEWQRISPLLALSASDNELNHTIELFCELSSYAASGNADDFERTREVLSFAISHISRLERLELKDIFDFLSATH